MAAQTRSEPDMTDPELENDLLDARLRDALGRAAGYGAVCLECGCVITDEEEYEQTPEGYICEICQICLDGEDDNDEIEDDFDDDEEDE